MLSTDDQLFLNWYEQQWHSTGELPTPSQLQSNYSWKFKSLSQARAWLDSPLIKRAFHNRGLINSTQANSDLDSRQLAAILLVANLSDRRGLKTKLNSVGVTLTQWNAWKKQKIFQEFLEQQLNKDLDTSLDAAFRGLHVGMDKGDPRAVQLYLELTGRQPTEVERNYRQAIARIVESVQRHVKDPQIIAAIARDFEQIEQGRSPIASLTPTTTYTPVVMDI